MLLYIYISIAVIVLLFFIIYSFYIQKQIAKLKYQAQINIPNSQQAYSLDITQGQIATQDLAMMKELQKKHETHVHKLENELDNMSLYKQQNNLNLTQTQSPNDLKVRAKSDLKNISNEMMVTNAQIVKMENKIESLPLFAQADALDKIQTTVHYVKNENVKETNTLKDVNQTILRNLSKTQDAKNTYDSILGYYSKKSDLDSYSSYLDKTLAKFSKVHDDIITINRVQNKYTTSQELRDLKDMVMKNDQDIKSIYAPKTNLKNLVDAKYIQSDIVPMNMMSGYAMRSDISSISYKNYKKAIAELDEKINKMNTIVRGLPNEYGTVNEAKDIMKLIERVNKESIRAQEKINYIMANYVKNTTFDQGLQTIDGAHKVSKKTIQNLQIQLDKLKDVMSRVPENYIKQADAVLHYSPQNKTNEMIRKMNAFPNLSVLNSLKVQYDPIFSKVTDIKDLQTQVDKFGNIDATFASLSDFKELTDFMDKKAKEKAAYDLAHAHDPYTQKGEVSYVLNGPDPKNVVAKDAGGWQNGWKYLLSDFDNWPAGVAMSYWGASWYKVLYPKPFYGPPTKITAKCVSYPAAKITINPLDTAGTTASKSTKGFIIYAEVGMPLADLQNTQTFSWSATGPR